MKTPHSLSQTLYISKFTFKRSTLYNVVLSSLIDCNTENVYISDYTDFMNSLVRFREWELFDIIFTQYYCLRASLCETLVLTAANNCDLDGLKRLNTYKIPFNYKYGIWDLFDSAIVNNRMDCIEYLQNIGWSLQNTEGIMCYDLASGFGHLEMLKYLHMKLKVLYWSDAYYAAQSGHLDCLKYMIENGVKCTEELYYHCIIGGSRECRQYLDSVNCPKCDNIDKWEQFWTKYHYL